MSTSAKSVMTQGSRPAKRDRVLAAARRIAERDAELLERLKNA